MARRLPWLLHRWWAVVKIFVLIVLLLVGGNLLWYRSVYHTLAFWSPPQRISYCDRDYQSDGVTLSRSQIESAPVSLPGDAHYPLSDMGRIVPVLGWPLSAHITPADRRVERGLPCTMVIYLRQAPDTYLAYGLLGGP